MYFPNWQVHVEEVTSMSADPVDALRVVDRQRAALASRVRLPWWYAVLFGAATLALVGSPIVVREASSTVSNWAVFAGIVVLLASDRLLGWATGARLSRGTLRDYPSSRPAGLAMIALFVVGIVAIWLLLPIDRVDLAIVVAVVVTVGVVRCLVGQTRGIRRDIREGRARTV
jgi:hypothetical protein